MPETVNCPDPGTQTPLQLWRRADTLFLVALLLLAGGMRLWHWNHTEVTARDSIGYIRMAWRLGTEPFAKVVKESHQHPGYPVALLATAKLLGHNPASFDSFHPDPKAPWQFQRAAQLLSSGASTLLVIPMFLLGRLGFGSLYSFWACLLFQSLPAAGRLFTDGLSEGIFLLFAAIALLGAWMSLAYFQENSGQGNSGRPVLWALVTGLFSGLSYLVRPEGLFIGGWTILGLAILVWKQGTHRKQRLIQMAVLASGLLLIGGPYMATIGHITSKPTAKQILEGEAITDTSGQSPRSPFLAPTAPMALSVPLAVWWEGGSEGALDRTIWGAHALVYNWVKGMFWVLWFPVLWTLWRFRTNWGNPWMLPLWGLVVTLLVALFKVASQMGYLSDRHLILLLMLGCYPAISGIFGLLGPTIRRLLLAGRSRLGEKLPSLVIAIVVALALTRTLEPLHANRAGFREAGEWIAQNSRPGDPVVDGFCWTHYHAGRVFTEVGPKGIPISDPSVQFIVIERSNNKHARLKTFKEEDLQAQGGKVVWTSTPRKDESVVVIYRVPWDKPKE